MLRSFTLLALSICSVASASAAETTTHHSNHAKDGRISVTLVNTGVTFLDVTVDGHTYTVQPHNILAVKGPAGTMVYAASSFGRIHRGDVLVALTTGLDQNRISIR
jgi:hypothetical protein